MQNELYGLMAEFDHPDALVHAVHKVHAQGYRKMDAYTPYPIEEVIEEIAPGNTGVPQIVGLFGFIGALSGFLIQYIGNFIDYRINVGGRPLGDPSQFAFTWDGLVATFNGWQAFVPITFEAGILLAAFGAVFGMLALNGFPQPYHPVFNAPRFERVSQDGYFLCIEAKDPLFDRRATRDLLQSLGARQISEVEN